MDNYYRPIGCCCCLTNTRFGKDLRIQVPPIRLRVAESLRQKRTGWREKRGRGRDRGDRGEREIHERKRERGSERRRSEEERGRGKRDRREARVWRRLRRRPSPSPLSRRRPDAHVGQEVEGGLCADKPGGGPRVTPERLSCETCWVRLAVEDVVSVVGLAPTLQA